MEAVATYGLPRRVRSDMGGENVGVAQYMWSQPCDGLETTRMIMGRIVFTTSGLSVFGGMSFKDVLDCTISFSHTWRTLDYLILAMKCICLHCISFICHGFREV